MFESTNLNVDDLNQLQDLPPHEALSALIKKRQTGTFFQFARVHVEQARFSVWRQFLKELHSAPLLSIARLVTWRYRPPLLHPVVNRMLAPVNPLLLCTALACYRCGIVSSAILQVYAEGLEVLDLESTFLPLEKLIPEGDLINCLEIESQFHIALEQIGLQKVEAEGPQMFNRVISKTPTMWDVRTAAWMAVNPIAVGGTRKHFWEGALAYGFEQNDSVHGVRKELQQQLESLTRSLNASLQQKRADVALLAAKHRNISLLLKRNFRIYQWLPHEISAHSAEMDFAILAMEAGALRTEDEHTMWRDRWELHLLSPSSVEKSLQAKHDERDHDFNPT
jgi:hypothetical protein